MYIYTHIFIHSLANNLFIDFLDLLVSFLYNCTMHQIICSLFHLFSYLYIMYFNYNIL